LNLSLHFSGPGIAISSKTIDGNIIDTLNYPYSIHIDNDSIMIFTVWAEERVAKDKEYRGKLTDEQHLKIKTMVSALNQEYEKSKVVIFDAMTCILKIDNKVHYEQKACEDNPEFSIDRFPPMPKEILLLFQYIVDLPPVRIMRHRQYTPPTIAHQKGTFTDTRDGKVYKTTKIGEQVWMAENLNYEASGSRCYNDSTAYCDKYGKLYNLETAIKACPNGWHLPSRDEWEVLTKTIGERTACKYLKSTSGWDKSYGEDSGNGDDKYGFSALPGGYRWLNGSFSKVGRFGGWWSATKSRNPEYPGNVVIRIEEYMNGATSDYPYEKDFLFSVRCVQGSAPPKGEAK
jgi:uncharacterized protein (TIGR02145 family)